MKTIISLTALSVVTMLTAVGCAAEGEEGEDLEASSADALSQAQCTRIVADQQKKSKAACAKALTDANKKASDRARLENAVVSAVAGFGAELQSYQGKGKATVDAAVRECSNVACSGSLQRDDVKALCDVEKAFLAGACYVRHVPAINAAASDIDFAQESAALDAAVKNMQSQWFSLAKQEGSLRAQHELCQPVAGGALERATMNAACRSSCSESDPLNPTASSKAACSPAGYAQVKDDLGKVVTCGTMSRPIANLGTVCECKETRGCAQFAALGASSQRGQACGVNKTQKLVWDGAKQEARFECR